ncbi:DDE-type integrase/transposase/recombinase [Acetobacter sp. LMG 1636]|uniref:DDE-type integrase/transposase/recombinase n=1 Tax=Acetobacter fallax TaxID=1737473 RepID=A0ABX0KEN3_9PROT|nr:DDE-type integrase/transposase/recombinase [Acetobacter fallax]NHO37479.1 DDE-type integrase/transposase/recombinase [Acetobacter fallax]
MSENRGPLLCLAGLSPTLFEVLQVRVLGCRTNWARAVNQKWVADITYIWTCEGWVCLTVVPDLFSRRIVGWSLDGRMTADLAVTALKRACLASAAGRLCASC